MKLNLNVMRLTGLALIVAAIVDAAALNWNRPDAAYCAQVGGAGCGPINYSLAWVLALVGFGLIVVTFFVNNGKGDKL